MLFPFFSDDHFEIRAKGAVHALTINKVAWNEGGEYKCVADGGAKTSATLLVKGKLESLFMTNFKAEGHHICLL